MADFQFAVDAGSGDSSTFINRVFKKCSPSIFDTDATCSICYAAFDQTTQSKANGDLPHFPVHLRKCGHSFGIGCLQQWFLISLGADGSSYTAQNNSCPMCRAVVFDFQDGMNHHYDPWASQYGGGRRLGEAEEATPISALETDEAFEAAVAASLRQSRPRDMTADEIAELGLPTMHNYPGLGMPVSLRHMIHGMGRRLGEVDDPIETTHATHPTAESSTSQGAPPQGNPNEHQHAHVTLDSDYVALDSDDDEMDSDLDHNYSSPATISSPQRPWYNYGSGHTVGEAPLVTQVDTISTNATNEEAPAVTQSQPPVSSLGGVSATPYAHYPSQNFMHGSGRRLGEATDDPPSAPPSSATLGATTAESSIPTPAVAETTTETADAFIPSTSTGTLLSHSPASVSVPSAESPSAAAARYWAQRGSGRRLDSEPAQESGNTNTEAAASTSPPSASTQSPTPRLQSYTFHPPALSYNETRWSRRHGGGQRLGD